eukprot:COSAG05_NODE_8_length_40675_cov_148.837539_28_plen_161_part_00
MIATCSLFVFPKEVADDSRKSCDVNTRSAGDSDSISSDVERASERASREESLREQAAAAARQQRSSALISHLAAIVRLIGTHLQVKRPPLVGSTTVCSTLCILLSLAMFCHTCVHVVRTQHAEIEARMDSICTELRDVKNKLQDTTDTIDEIAVFLKSHK